MKTRPLLLDLFCGAGGAAMGYHRAGFNVVVGIDLHPQKHYPFTFIQMDAMEALDPRVLRQFDAIHASPPCQRHSVATMAENRESHPDLLPLVLDALRASGRPWVVENVPGAPVPNPIVLCGLMFGLKVFRHRLFASSEILEAPEHISHRGRRIGEGMFSVAGGAGWWKTWGTVQRDVMKGTAAEWRDAMGIDWMTRKELTQAIPPAYTEWIGRQLMRRFMS